MTTETAIAAFISILGQAKVTVDEPILLEYEANTFETENRVIGVIFPESTSDIQAALKIANAAKISVYPISKGMNWGLGSRVPTRSGAVILDLGRMNKIIDYNPEFGTITVAPGVSFQQAHDFLVEQNSDYMVPVTGGPPAASLIGNALERGHGLGPLWDRATHLCGLEVILPTGEIVRTGIGDAECLLATLTKNGSGPSIEGLFFQSNMGIATQATFWLMKKPSHFRSFFMSVGDTGQLGGLIDAIREIKLTSNPITISLFNDMRVLSIKNQYPWRRMTEPPPLTPSLLDQLKRQGVWFGGKGVGKWNGHGAIYAQTRQIAAANQRFLAQKLRPHVDKLSFYNSFNTKVMRLLAPLIQGVSKADINAILDLIYDKSILRGIPTNEAGNMAYWRKKQPAPFDKDPNRDRCGLIWFCPTVPLISTAVLKAIDIIESVSYAYGFEPNIGLLCLSDRTTDVTGALCYDRDIPGEDEKAMACHDEIMSRLIEHQFYPYRLGVCSMKFMASNGRERNELIRKIKNMIDPNGILSPGRYESPAIIDATSLVFSINKSRIEKEVIFFPS